MNSIRCLLINAKWCEHFIKSGECISPVKCEFQTELVPAEFPEAIFVPTKEAWDAEKDILEQTTLEEAKNLEPGDVVVPLIGTEKGQRHCFEEVNAYGLVMTTDFKGYREPPVKWIWEPSSLITEDDFYRWTGMTDCDSTKDAVNHPSHYTDGQIEVIDFIEDKRLNFHRGCAVKDIARAGKKNPDKEVEDLQKAVWYLNREISRLMAAQGDSK